MGRATRAPLLLQTRTFFLVHKPKIRFFWGGKKSPVNEGKKITNRASGGFVIISVPVTGTETAGCHIISLCYFFIYRVLILGDDNAPAKRLHVPDSLAAK